MPSGGRSLLKSAEASWTGILVSVPASFSFPALFLSLSRCNFLVLDPAIKALCVELIDTEDDTGVEGVIQDTGRDSAWDFDVDTPDGCSPVFPEEAIGDRAFSRSACCNLAALFCFVCRENFLQMSHVATI